MDQTRCPHDDGYLVLKRHGNISSIASVRAHIEVLAHTQFPLIKAKVVYSGNGGESIPAAESPGLLDEATLLLKGASDPHVTQFATELIEICKESLKTGNPIVF